MSALFTIKLFDIFFILFCIMHGEWLEFLLQNRKEKLQPNALLRGRKFEIEFELWMPNS